MRAAARRQRAPAELLPSLPADWPSLIAGMEERGDRQGFGPQRLGRMVYDGEALLGIWLTALRRHGWTALDLFGVHPAAPATRFDCMGLVPVMSGASVRTIGEASVVLSSVTGTRLTFRRPTAGGVLIWAA